MNQIAEHLLQVKERIVQAASRAGRSRDHIQLLAVSKTKPLEAVCEAYAAGQRRFGESYAQEAATKIDTLREQGVCGTLSARCNRTSPSWWPSVSTGCRAWTERS